MMKKSNRRTTLSSADLDSFLTEVNQVEIPLRRKTLCSSDDSENVNPNVTLTHGHGQLFNKQISKDSNSKGPSESLPPGSNEYNSSSNEQKIRFFCKVISTLCHP